MNTLPIKPQCWVMSEGMAGTENQCLGVAEALGLNPEIKRISLREPWRSLSPYLGFEGAHTFSPPFFAPWPDLLIACGRKSIAASRYIKRASKGKTFTVQLQDPRISPKNFDLVAVPQHDPLRGPNVIVTMAAPNRITPGRINAAKAEFSHFHELPEPRIALLIGGSSKSFTMTDPFVSDIARQLSPLSGSLMITTSRRTAPQHAQMIRQSVRHKPHFFWDGQSANPYLGMLAWADFILVTADSASMLSEASSTSKPVYGLGISVLKGRLASMAENLVKSGHIRPFEGKLEHWAPLPLQDAQSVAREILRRWPQGAGLSAS